MLVVCAVLFGIGAIDTVTELPHASADPAVPALDGNTAIFCGRRAASILGRHSIDWFYWTNSSSSHNLQRISSEGFPMTGADISGP